jgi:type I site-specific restriction endonuclease
VPGKTLVVCANDAHADMVVDLLSQALGERYGSGLFGPGEDKEVFHSVRAI